jgi:hypothetical protein
MLVSMHSRSMEPMRKGERRETSERQVPYICIVNGDWQRRGLYNRVVSPMLMKKVGSFLNCSSGES